MMMKSKNNFSGEEVLVSNKKQKQKIKRKRKGKKWVETSKKYS